MTSGAENAFTLTGRLVTLRSARVQDLNRLAEARDDAYISEAFNAPPDPADAKAAAAWLEGTGALARAGMGYSFVIADRNSNDAVGRISMFLRARAPDGRTGYIEEAHGRASLSYWVRPSQRGRGYATDALTTLSEWALHLPEVERLEAYIEPWNEASWRAAERAGYQREGLLRSWQRIGNERRDMYVYSCLPTDRLRLRPQQ